jgi:nitrogen-specific signal transduction histidine kinase
VSYGKVDGSGLGLAIAKKIVEDHDGEIYLDTRNVSGTLFRIKIPFDIPKGAVPVAPMRSKRKSRSMSLSVNTP